MIGVVLAGGASRRMGSDKALVEVGGRPMISWVIEALTAVVDDVLVAGRPGGWDLHRGLVDAEGVSGPLAGLAAGLRLGPPVLLVAVDQPWLRSGTLRNLRDVGTTVVPTHNDIRQVTCAVYYPEVGGMVGNHESLQSLLDEIVPLEITGPVWTSWGEDGRSWFSVDTPADIELGMERFGPPGS